MRSSLSDSIANVGAALGKPIERIPECCYALSSRVEKVSSQIALEISVYVHTPMYAGMHTYTYLWRSEGNLQLPTT